MFVAITGGAGFIGSNLADKLIERGDRVRIVDNLETGQLPNINSKAEVVIGSISHNVVMEEFMSYVPDVVVHAAASYKDPDNWAKDTFTNTVGTVKLLETCKRVGVKRIIYFQTSLCYGPPQEHPITLNHPINPQNSYAITKTAAEQFIAMSGISFVSFRLANVYGPRNLAGAVPAFYKRITEGKSCVVFDTRRDFVFIDDLLYYVLKAIDGIGEGYYHVSTGRDYSIWTVFRCVQSALNIPNVDVEFKPKMPEDVSSILLDPSETYREFGEPEWTELDKGISEAIKWYKENGVGEAYTHLPQKQFKGD
mgnify:CR=1 FL=1